MRRRYNVVDATPRAHVRLVLWERRFATTRNARYRAVCVVWAGRCGQFLGWSFH